MDSWAVHVLKRVVVVAVMAMCLHVTPALAHALLVKAEPPRRAVLAKAPAQVQLWFNEEIEDAYSSLIVLDAGKHPVSDVTFQLAPDDRSPTTRCCQKFCDDRAGKRRSPLHRQLLRAGR